MRTLTYTVRYVEGIAQKRVSQLTDAATDSVPYYQACWKLKRSVQLAVWGVTKELVNDIRLLVKKYD